MIYRVYNDVIALEDIFILYVNSGMIFLVLCDLSVILKISGYISYMLFIRYDPTSLEIDLLASFIVHYILKVSFFKGKGLYKMRHLYYLGCVTVRVGPGLGVGGPEPVRFGLKKQSLNPDQKPGRSGPGPRPGCQEFQEMPRLVLTS
jgi:hypothetical protein